MYISVQKYEKVFYCVVVYIETLFMLILNYL